MTITENHKSAQSIAENWGQFLTQASKDGDITAFKEMFVSGPVDVVLQNEDGQEVKFFIGDTEENCDMTWDEFAQTALRDLQMQDYDRSESTCLGVLGKRMILELLRYNKNGEVYLTATSLVEFNDEGKILGYEAFSDVGVSGVVEAVQEADF